MPRTPAKPRRLLRGLSSLQWLLEQEMLPRERRDPYRPFVVKVDGRWSVWRQRYVRARNAVEELQGEWGVTHDYRLGDYVPEDQLGAYLALEGERKMAYEEWRLMDPKALA